MMATTITSSGLSKLMECAELLNTTALAASRLQSAQRDGSIYSWHGGSVSVDHPSMPSTRLDSIQRTHGTHKKRAVPEEVERVVCLWVMLARSSVSRPQNTQTQNIR